MMGCSKKVIERPPTSQPPGEQHFGPAKRSGFSLIEVMIATAILMGSAIVLSRLAGMGRDQSQKAKLHTDAQQLCEMTMNELLLGLRSIEPSESLPLVPLLRPVQDSAAFSEESELFAPAEVVPQSVSDETNPEWRHSIRMDLVPGLPGMWALTVVVMQGDETLIRDVRFTLTRWISGPPAEGAFDELSRGFEDPSSLEQGDLL